MSHRRNYTRYPLLEKDFRTSYDAVWASQGIGINPNDIRFLPLLFVILALSVRVAPESLAGDDRQRRLSSLRYYWSCTLPFEHLLPLSHPTLFHVARRSMLLAAAIHSDSMELVLARLLVCCL